MYKMILVDDDPHVLEGYKRKIDWKKLGIDLVATAMDGKEALDQIISLTPEIIITDIKMPIMDGIELIKEIDRLGLHTHVIIQSGYDEFDFAKQAIRYNAVAYLLKPTSKEEIIEVVNEVIQTIKKEQIATDDLMVNQLKMNKRNIVESLMKQIPKKKITDMVLACYENITPSDKVAAVVLKKSRIHMGDIPEIESHKIEIFNGVISHRWDENSWVMLFFMSDTFNNKEVLKKVLWEMVDLRDRLMDQEIRIAIGSIGNGLNQLPESLASALKLIELRALVKAEDIMMPSDNDNIGQDTIPDVSVIEQSIEKQTEDELYLELIDYFVQVKGSTNIDKVYYEKVMTSIFKMVLLLLKYPGNRENLPSEYEIWEGLLSHDSIEALEDHVVQLIKTIFEAKNHYNNQKLSKPVLYVVQYVNKHYMDVILLKELSKTLFISENYLTTLFKKEMSLTFKKYLTKMRMEKAKELLAKPSLKVRQVAQQVGYSNDDYFSKIFKQTTGLTPSEYRVTITYKIN